MKARLGGAAVLWGTCKPGSLTPVEKRDKVSGPQHFEKAALSLFCLAQNTSIPSLLKNVFFIIK